jgi:hypothetical protein
MSGEDRLLIILRLTAHWGWLLEHFIHPLANRIDSSNFPTNYILLYTTDSPDIPTAFVAALSKWVYESR